MFLLERPTGAKLFPRASRADRWWAVRLRSGCPGGVASATSSSTVSAAWSEASQQPALAGVHGIDERIAGGLDRRIRLDEEAHPLCAFGSHELTHEEFASSPERADAFPRSTPTWVRHVVNQGCSRSRYPKAPSSHLMDFASPLSEVDVQSRAPHALTLTSTNRKHRRSHVDRVNVYSRALVKA